MKRDTNALDQALQSLFEKRGYPGIAVTIRGPEGILFEKGYGYRDVEHQLPADTHTIFGEQINYGTLLCNPCNRRKAQLGRSDHKIFSNAAYSGNPG